MAQKNSKKELGVAQKVGIGVGLTAAAVAAAGAYFLYGSKEATMNRKKVKGWMLKAKGDVLEALEKAENITESEYKAIVEAVGGAYSTAKNATSGEIKDFKKEMKAHWETLEKSGVAKKMETIAKNVIAPKKAPVKKVVAKKVAKAIPKKSAKKAA